MLAPGALLQERYQIICLIAQGGVGAVYQAVDQRLGNTVAIKQIIRGDVTLRAAFEQEARLLAALRHPALPNVTDHFNDASGQFLVMEFIPGDDLATLALRQTQSLAVGRVLHWADQLLDLLTYLHSQTPPVIHRDIKPHNLKLNAQGAVILLDFGLAKGAPGQTPAGRSIAGYTLHYAPPEQLRGEQSEPRSDLYSLAATLYDLLAVTRPPDALQRLATIATGQPDPLQPLQTRNPAVPLTVAAVIHQALALSPQARFADAAAMRLAFHSAGGDSTEIVSRTEHLSTSHPSIPGPTHNLPAQLTSFVAREAEVAAVQQLLQGDGVRLVTLTGPGGIGKSRLALAIATRCLANFRDGVFFVLLASIDEIALVLPTIAQTLGLREMPNTTVRQNLHAHLQDKELLLVLDNFEQVVTAAAEITALLAAAPRLKILVTSREALQVRGEQEFPVPALELPDLRQLPASEEVVHYAAIRLFVQRAQAVKPGFTLHSANAAAIVEICKRLDGLPLALELAAASVKFLSVQAILVRLAERFELPTIGLRDLPDRQRTLHASIGWSYDLLTAEEKALFRRLCVFSGSFTLEAAEALGQNTGIGSVPVLDIIVSLTGKSLLKSLEIGEDEPRFTLLETIREFGLKRLDEAGETQAARAAHAAYYDQLVQEAERRIWGAAVAESVSHLDAEIENLRAALSHYLAHPQGAEASLRFAGSLWRFWEIRGYIQEGRAWLDRALQRRAEVPPANRWLPLHGAGNLAVDQGDYALSNAYYLEALHLLQEMLLTLTEPLQIWRTRRAIGNTLANMGHTAMLQSQWEEAVALSEEAITIHRQLIDEQSHNRTNGLVGLAIPITNLALIKLYQSHYDQAEAFGTEGLTIYRELGDERGIGWNLHTLATVARDRGDYGQATKLYQEAKLLFEKLSNQTDMASLYFDLGELARVQGDHAQAEVEYRRGLTLAQTLGSKKEEANLLGRLSLLARCRGDYAAAATLSEQSILLQRAIGNLFGVSDALQIRGELAFAQRNFPAAAADLRESLRLKAHLGKRKGIIALLKTWASLEIAESGRADRAARLLAAAETLRLTIGVNVPPSEHDTDEARLHEIRAALGQNTFAAAWAEGEMMDFEQAIASVLNEK
ncbi:MAG: protein kinase [Caldilineaceae bacterium]|nr:protein kinase [Caldilineaceae bacterium]